jgi:hypothetical protein
MPCRRGFCAQRLGHQRAVATTEIRDRAGRPAGRAGIGRLHPRRPFVSGALVGGAGARRHAHLPAGDAAPPPPPELTPRSVAAAHYISVRTSTSCSRPSRRPLPTGSGAAAWSAVAVTCSIRCTAPRRLARSGCDGAFGTPRASVASSEARTACRPASTGSGSEAEAVSLNRRRSAPGRGSGPVAEGERRRASVGAEA